MNTTDNRIVPQITRAHPSAFIFMIDVSGSMEEKISFRSEVKTKAAAVAEIVNSTLSEIVNRCKREDGYREYLDLAVIGYSDDEVRSLLPEGGDHPVFRKPHELALARVEKIRLHRERRLPNGKTIVTPVEMKQWIKPLSSGNTPMYKAFSQCYRLAAEWTARHRSEPCFPPVVIHITDGEATDAEENDLNAVCRKIRELSTGAGNVLLMNIYLGNGDRSIAFPSSEDQLPESRYARMLYRFSSVMPPVYREEIEEITGSCHPGEFRGMGYNCTLSDLIGMLRIGSLSVTLLA